MKKIIFLSGLMAIFSMPVWANDYEDQHIIQQAAQNHISIAQALKTSKDTPVTVDGVIVSKIKHEHYRLKDQTGVMNVEIDDDLVNPAQLKNGTKIRVIGEIDTHRYKETDIDAVKVVILN